MATLFFGGLDTAFTAADLRRFIKDVTGLRTKSTSVKHVADHPSYGFADFKSPLEMLLALVALHAAGVRARPVLRGTGAGGRGAEPEALSYEGAAACWYAAVGDAPRAAWYLKFELGRLLEQRGGFSRDDAYEAAAAIVSHVTARAPTVAQGLRAAMALLHYPALIAPWAAAALVKPALATPESAAADQQLIAAAVQLFHNEVARRLRGSECSRDGHEMAVALRDALLRGDATAGTLRATLWWALRCAHGTGSAHAVISITKRELAEWRRRRTAAPTQGPSSFSSIF
jgi:hypothetical protein